MPVVKQGTKWAVLRPDGTVDLVVSDQDVARRLAVACGYDDAPARYASASSTSRQSRAEPPLVTHSAEVVPFYSTDVPLAKAHYPAMSVDKYLAQGHKMSKALAERHIIHLERMLHRLERAQGTSTDELNEQVADLLRLAHRKGSLDRLRMQLSHASNERAYTNIAKKAEEMYMAVDDLLGEIRLAKAAQSNPNLQGRSLVAAYEKSLEESKKRFEAWKKRKLTPAEKHLKEVKQDCEKRIAKAKAELIKESFRPVRRKKQNDFGPGR